MDLMYLGFLHCLKALAAFHYAIVGDVGKVLIVVVVFYFLVVYAYEVFAIALLLLGRVVVVV
jgi:hypothetical protein